MGNRMSSGKIQAKILHEIRSVGSFHAGWMEEGENVRKGTPSRPSRTLLFLKVRKLVIVDKH